MSILALIHTFSIMMLLYHKSYPLPVSISFCWYNKNNKLALAIAFLQVLNIYTFITI